MFSVCALSPLWRYLYVNMNISAFVASHSDFLPMHSCESLVGERFLFITLSLTHRCLQSLYLSPVCLCYTSALLLFFCHVAKWYICYFISCYIQLYWTILFSKLNHWPLTDLSGIRGGILGGDVKGAASDVRGGRGGGGTFSIWSFWEKKKEKSILWNHLKHLTL